MSTGRILIVDDQAEIRTYVRGILEDLGYDVIEAEDGDSGLVRFGREAANLSLVILDLDFGTGKPDGLDTLRRMKEISEEVPVVILSGKATVSSAVDAVKLGAADVLEKDTYIEKTLEASVEKIRRFQQVVDDNRRLVQENRALRKKADYYESQFRRKYEMVGDSPAFQRVIEEARRVANIPRPVLILGERGTGKELAAALIHYSSERHDQPFVTVNCSAFHGNLLESEIFGHEKGAFTGADKRKIGRFELADGGTLFLDEIGNMPTDFQEKILRVLEYQKFERVAGNETIEVNVRVVAATNADLTKMMEEEQFRRDLYDRLSFKVIHLPTLAERAGDVPLLVEHFRQGLIEEVPWVAERSFSPAAIEVLAKHSWPGNVRELKNVVERLLCAGDHAKIDATEVALELGESGGSESAPQSFTDRIAAEELRLLLDALKQSGGNQRAAADTLGLTYDQFRHLYKKYKIKERLVGGDSSEA